MASDQVVGAQDVLRAVMELRRPGGVQQAMEELEKQEPHLTEFLLEEVSAVYQQLRELAGKPRREQRLVRRIESMAIVLVSALRKAHLRLWQEEAADTRLSQRMGEMSSPLPAETDSKQHP